MRRKRVIVIGAGMAGLTAAARLHQAGCQVRVLDKGRGVGGRMATRRIGRAVFDHGAQFMTAKNPNFRATLATWQHAGVVTEWCRGFGQNNDGHLRWRGCPAMTAVAKHLARGLDVRLQTRVAAVQREENRWLLVCEAGESLTAEALVVTAPVPQTLALLSAGNTPLPSALRDRLASIRYESCLAVMARLEGSAEVPDPGGLQIDEEPVAWIADNQAKGVSPVPAATIHATPGFSARYWDADRTEAGRILLHAAARWVRREVCEFQVHGWRYSKPKSVDPDPCPGLSDDPPLVIAGDAFGGPRVEGAFLSGWAAAQRLLDESQESP